jgi:hypothetical protein
MKCNIPPNKVPDISNKDLKRLYDYAEKIINVGKKYGLSTIVSIYSKAYEQIKKG